MGKATGLAHTVKPKNELSLHMLPKLIVVKFSGTYFPEHL